MTRHLSEPHQNRGFSLYVHFPFCRSRCLYCSFYSTLRSPLQSEYVDALCRELDNPWWPIADEPLRTIYFGGGTPSSVHPYLLEKLCCKIRNTFSTTSAPDEFTLEVNPEDVTTEFVKVWKECGATRFSMGVQTLEAAELRSIGRRHSPEQVKQAAALLGKEADLSLDLICGLPGQTPTSFRRSLEDVLAMKPDHISVYMLELEKDSALRRLVDSGKMTLPAEEETSEMYLDMCGLLKSEGFEHYEISNFALPGHRSLHNSRYWDGTDYLGLGTAAASYFAPDFRCVNSATLEDYINSGPKPANERLTRLQQQEEYILTRLRTVEGISFDEYSTRFGSRSSDALLAAAQEDIHSGLLKAEDGYLRLASAEACLLSDAIMVRLLPD